LEEKGGRKALTSFSSLRNGLAFYSGLLTVYLICGHDTAHAMTHSTHTITNPADFIRR